MAEVWVDAELLAAAARTVGAAGKDIDTAKPADVQVGSMLDGASVVDACDTGSRATGRVVEVVAELLHSWSGLAQQAADDYIRTDEAAASLLFAAGDPR
ncbi:hypothetical protein [Prescottella sp. R16]|uniref:hypothetical protein n=1 Tax=Prescottella sp. R16 TaxID=3064529 RepID=UPI00272E9A52|nr:hypothetical protein [Prescottella sp. R16]